MVYVDDMRAHFRGMIMCHMLATDFVELHLMAGMIGIHRNHFQGDHYDISLSKKRLALQHGAIPITMRQAGHMTAYYRMHGLWLIPEDAERILNPSPLFHVLTARDYKPTPNELA
jgi:hypothetical protein